MNYTLLDSSFQCASFESKKFYLAFFVKEKFPKKKQKTQIFAYFWLPHQQMGSMGRTFHMPDFNSSYTITLPQFRSNRRQKKFSKKPRLPTFHQICTPKKHLKGGSSLIKQHMAMNFAPLDCPCQGASSESKKIYLNFFILEKIAKNQKIHIFGSHRKKWVQWPELLLYLNSTDPIQ
jgi:hypothetical protein